MVSGAMVKTNAAATRPFTVPVDAKDPAQFRMVRDFITKALEAAGVRFFVIRPRQRTGMLHIVVEDDKPNLTLTEATMIACHDPQWKGFARNVAKIKGSAIQIDTVIVDTPID
jgi:hypothetical protein